MKMRRIILSACMGVLVVVFSCSNVLAGNAEEGKTTGFSINELKSHMFFLASDYLGGRVTGEDGYDIAAAYVESQFYAAGLKPFIQEENGDSSFLQNFEIIRKDYFLDEPLLVKCGNDSVVFRHGKDFKLVSKRPGGVKNGYKQVVFVGFGIEEPDESWNDLEKLEVENKIVLVMNGAPTDKGDPLLSPEKHELYSSRAGLNAKLRNIIAKNPAAILLVTDEMLADYYERMQSRKREFSLEYDGHDLRAEFMEVFYRLAMVKPAVAEAILKGTKMDLEKFSQGKLARYETMTIPDVQLRMDIRIEPEARPVANVAGFVPGTDSLLKHEFLVIGAHLDHVPNFMGLVNNGADDNASGVSLIMELAEKIAENPLKRSVVFVAYTGEEGGLHGSRHFVKNFPHEKKQIAAALNFDCVGRNGKNATERFQTYILDAAKICPDIIPLVEQINERTVQFKLTYEMKNRWGTSDQESFMNEGIPVVDFFNGGTVDLHRPTDEVEKIDFEYLQKMCILGHEIARKLGNMEGRMCGKEAL